MSELSKRVRKTQVAQIREPMSAFRFRQEPLADEIRRIGIRCIIFPQMSTFPYNRTLAEPSSMMSCIRIAMSLGGFAKLLKTNSIDIVYLNNMMLWPYLRPAREAGCRTVLHVREHWPLNEHRRQLEAARTFAGKYADRIVAINSFTFYYLLLN